METLTNDGHPLTKWHGAKLGIAKAITPSLQPSSCCPMIGERVMQQRHQVRLALPSIPDENQRPALARTYRLYCGKRICRWISDLQELARRNLRGSGVSRIRKFDRSAFESTLLELPAKCQVRHRLLLVTEIHEPRAARLTGSTRGTVAPVVIKTHGATVWQSASLP